MNHKTIVYIDAQNIYMGVKHLGRDIDRKKFYFYLHKKFSFCICKIFYGYKSENHDLYKSLEQYGYEVILKKTSMKANGELKGDVDIDIGIHVIDDLYTQSIDHCVIVSGDGDFVSLYEYLTSKNTEYSIVIPTIARIGSHLKQYPLIDISPHRFFLEKKKSP